MVRALALAAALLLVTAGCSAGRGSSSDTTRPHRGTSLFNPAWSRDGKRVAWTTSGTQIWVAAADGSDAHAVTPRIDALGRIAWLPDGRLLYWADFRLFTLKPSGRSSYLDRVSGNDLALDARATLEASGPPACSLCVGWIEILPLTGTSSGTTIGGDHGRDESPTFSPDGREVAFSRTLVNEQVGDRPAGIWIAAVRGGPMRRLTTSGWCPSWSPDGRSILVSRSRRRTIWAVPASGGAPSLLAHASPCTAAWAPDSRSVAVVEGELGPLAILDTRTRRRRVDTGPALGQILALAWSPDSKQLLVSARPTARSCSSLWQVDASDGAAHLFRKCF